MSQPFTAGQDVHQGAPWSMYLFEKHYDELLHILKCGSMGTQIYHLKTGNPAFADDLSITCLHKPLLQKQLDKVYQYSVRWRFRFNPSKSVILIFGEDTCPRRPLSLGGSEIVVKKGDEHMGIFIGDDLELEKQFIKKRIQKARKAYFMSQNIGSRSVPITPIAMSKLYWSVCIPSMTHGLEVSPLNSGSVDLMEQAHGSMAKMSQGLPQQTANVACLAPLGWRCLGTHIEYLKLMFLWRILLLPADNIYKMVVLMRLWYHLYDLDNLIHIGPLVGIVNVFTKYGLLSILDTSINRGEFMSICRFKSVVRQCVSELEYARYRMTCMLYKSLSLFTECIKNIQMWVWWKFAHNHCHQTYKVRMLCRLVVGQSCLKEVVSHYDKSSPMCTLCDSNQVETPQHLLFECAHFEDMRSYLWQRVISACPQTIREELLQTGVERRTGFIMSGFHTEYVDDWSDMYCSVLDFCCALYVARRNIDAIE
jgi:hypothetical protein